MKRFAQYIRLSTGPQEKGVGADKQDRVNREYVGREGGQLAATYRDTITGKVKTRAGLDQLLLDGKRGHFEAVVVYDVKRQGRLVQTILQIGEEVMGAGLELHFSQSARQVDLSNPSDRLLFQIEAIGAEQDYFYTINRLYDDRVAKAVGGKYSGGGLPYWIRRVYNEDGSKRYELDPERAPVVARMFEYADRGMGTIRIAGLFDQAKYPTPKGGARWYENTVRTMLKTRSVTGLYTYSFNAGRGGPVRVTVELPAVVSLELFERVQLKLAGRKRGGPRNSRLADYPLIGMLRCGECGWSLKLQDYRRAGARLICRNPDCVHIGSHRYDRLQEACLHLANEAIKRNIRLFPPFPAVQPGPDLKNEQKAAIGARRARVLEMMEAGVYTLAEGKARLRKLEAELAQLEAAMAAVPEMQMLEVDLPDAAEPARLREAGVVFLVGRDSLIISARGT